MNEKKITLELVEKDGNAFTILGSFRRQSRKEGWSEDEIKEVMDEARSRDYNYLLSTIQKHCK